MKQWLWGLAVGLIGLTGCFFPITQIHGVTPTYPEVCPASLSLCKVDSLTPLFRWTPAYEPDVRYDFIIYEAHEIGCSFLALLSVECEWAIGREVYYREGLQKPEHTVEISLQPDSEYYWSVRIRYGDNVSSWSRFEYRWVYVTPTLVGQDAWEFPFFLFKTPAEK